MIHTEALYDLQSRLVQGECKSKNSEYSLISFVVVWIEVTDGVGQRTVWLTIVKRAFEPMLSAMFKFCQYFKTNSKRKKKKAFKKCGQ